MTWVSEGALRGADGRSREYAVRREGGASVAFVCVLCLLETPLDAGAFAGHVCGAPPAEDEAGRPEQAAGDQKPVRAPRARPTTTTTEAAGAAADEE